MKKKRILQLFLLIIILCCKKNVDNNKLLTKEYRYGRGDLLLSYFTYDYNEKNILIKKNHFYTIDNIHIDGFDMEDHQTPDTKKEFQTHTYYEYDTNGKLSLESFFDDAGISLSYRIIYEYDDINNLVKKIQTYEDGQKNTTVYEYDEDNFLKKEIYYNSFNNVVGYFLYDYDNGNMIKKSFYNSKGNSFSYNTYEYNIDGKLFKTSLFVDSGKLDEYIDFEYDSQNTLKRKSRYSYNGELYEYFVYEFITSP